MVRISAWCMINALHCVAGRYRKMVYGWVVVLQVMDAELHKAKGMWLALWRGVVFCKPEQSRQQPAG